jgi:flagellar basal body-associated protein FliL
MKKIIVIIIILLVCFLIALGILVMQNQKSTSKTQSYKISFLVDKEGFKDVFLNDSKDSLPAKAIEQYLTFFLNGPGDLIWVNCNENYKLKSYVSNTGENIISDPSIGLGLELEKYIYKHLSLTCEKYE